MLNGSVGNRCGVVVTNILHNQQWMEIACDQSHSRNRYFICERLLDSLHNKTKHHRALENFQHCPRTYIYYLTANDLHCLTFNKSIYINNYNMIINFTLDQWMNAYLSKWSLRLSTLITINSTSALTTTRILHPDIRQWRVVNATRPSKYGIMLTPRSRQHYPGQGHNHFLCKDSSLVLVQYQCDGKGDCKDNSDEMYCEDEWKDVCGNCTVYCALRYCDCQLMRYHCPSGGCISYNLVCDGAQDCDDGSDELSCVRVSPLFVLNHVCK